ncbi:YpzG family protein [Ureibacillus chungkukjangi]|uniref:YpzG family protein n=1 Tax=Ureibacillus chungkukjangi TaxID=1202712 RepID=UPI000D3CBD03|nr:YpzG family protein [Ureibacillus chungkukjangi]MCM3388759.1 YpzG family protein [Ureibacillus chungkukjangi]
MGKKGILDPNSSKNHRNWEKPKFHKSQMNGETKISLHNQLLRTAAKVSRFT